VRRKLVLFEADEHGERQCRLEEARIALAFCPTCKRRVRVLPCDVLPRKRYALGLIEHEVASYARGARSLRQVAWSVLGEPAPAHTTLHAWSEGLGAHVLGRATGAALGAEPFSRLLAESVARVPAAEVVARTQVPVDPRRFRSEARHERLGAVGMSLSVAALVTGLLAPDALSEWRRLALARRELYAYLDCGILANGFARVHCAGCGRDELVAFSCKGRGFCPSCCGRRMAESAMHLADEVLPAAPLRQWVVSFPYPVRLALAYDAPLCTSVRRILVRTLLGWLAKVALEADDHEGRERLARGPLRNDPPDRFDAAARHRGLPLLRPPIARFPVVSLDSQAGGDRFPNVHRGVVFRVPLSHARRSLIARRRARWTISVSKRRKSPSLSNASIPVTTTTRGCRGEHFAAIA
jgi:hypothetical protein